VVEGKNEERIDFFEKKLLKSLSVQKKALPLHSHLEKCLEESGIFEQVESRKSLLLGRGEAKNAKSSKKTRK
jgi:hypothetical protein